MSEPVRCQVPQCSGDDRQPRLVFRVICPHHEAQVVNDTRALSSIHARLRAALADSRVPDVLVSSSGGPVLPINIGVYSMLEHVESHVRFYFALIKIMRTNEPVTGQVRYLSALRYLDQNMGHLLASSTYAVEYAARTHRLHMTARRTLGLVILVHRLPAPCPACDLLSLVRVDGADEVVCESCHTTWTEADYLRLCRVLAWENRK